MFKRILLAVDESKPSQYALKKSIELAQDQGATLQIVLVVDFASYGMGIKSLLRNSFLQKMRTEGEKILSRAETMAEKKGVKVKTTLIDLFDYKKHVADKILEVANKSRADLIVIASHGRRGLSRIVFGSVTEHAIRNSKIPILVFRRD